MQRFLVLGTMLIAATLWASGASAAIHYSQSNVLRGPDTGLNCNGANHGKCIIAEISGSGTNPYAYDNIKVTCTLHHAAPNASFQVFWVATNVARGCHNNSTGFVSLGTLLTGSTGAGKFVRTMGNSPFPGQYVHFDLCQGSTGGCSASAYASVFGALPIGSGPFFAPADSGGSGDPAIK